MTTEPRKAKRYLIGSQSDEAESFDTPDDLDESDHVDDSDDFEKDNTEEAENGDSLEDSDADEERLRNRAQHWRGRSFVIQVQRLPLHELERGRRLFPDVPGVDRPKTRADCVDGERPCPFVGCRYHLAIDVSSKTGSIKINQPPGLELEEMEETCALDVADQGGRTLEEVGVIMNLTRERVRQLETMAFKKLKKLPLPQPRDFEGRTKNRTDD